MAKIPVHVGSGVKAPLIILATLAVLAAFDYAESLILPVVLAFVISLTLTPINMWLQRRMWPGLSAFILVTAVTMALAIAALTLAQPISAYINDAPSIGRQLRERLADFREPVESITEASKEMEEITKATSDPTVNEVVMRQPGLLNRAASNIGNVASTLVVAIALTYFLLVTNRLIYEKIVHASPKLSDKKRSLMVVNNIVTTVSKYLLTITIINAGFGVTIAAVMFALGMPSPALWGLAAFLLEFSAVRRVVGGNGVRRPDRPFDLFRSHLGHRARARVLHHHDPGGTLHHAQRPRTAAGAEPGRHLALDCVVGLHLGRRWGHPRGSDPHHREGDERQYPGDAAVRDIPVWNDIGRGGRGSGAGARNPTPSLRRWTAGSYADPVGPAATLSGRGVTRSGRPSAACPA